jgi:hypothetical protein
MTSRTSRRGFLAATGLAALAGCLGSRNRGRAPTDAPTGSASPTASETTAGGRGGDAVPTASETLPVAYSVEELRQRTVSGGPPKDGIPSVDQPVFGSPAEADEWLAPADIVFGVARGGEVKAYPQRILVWHEIVNDTLDGDTVSVTYCPLTGTAMGFQRGSTTFGVSGRLVNSNLVMYDRATDSRWPQMLATAVEGELQGESLVEFPVTWTTWSAWKAVHPDTEVLTRDTGYARNYSRDPYGQYNPAQGYYTDDSTLFAPLDEDDRFRPKTVIVGARPPEGPLAFRKATVNDEGVVRETVGGASFLAVFDRELDAALVYRDDGSREFTYDDGRVTDAAGTAYAPTDLPLERVVAFDAMWFAWFGFYPGTVVYA